MQVTQDHRHLVSWQMVVVEDGMRCITLDRASASLSAQLRYIVGWIMVVLAARTTTLHLGFMDVFGYVILQ